MDWSQHVVPLVSAVIGGVLVIIGQRLQTREQSRQNRADQIVALYTDFLVRFQMTLHHHETYWSGAMWSLEHGESFRESDKAREARVAAESGFREAASRLRLRERDKFQQEQIDLLSRAFDRDIENVCDYNDMAIGFKGTARALRDQAGAIVSRMQDLHRKTLDVE